MTPKKILFISGSIGLGHVGRDLEIAKALRKENAGIDIPWLAEHLAAADLCIVTGGGTVTLELTALQRPFLYFPLEHHFEQEIEVAARCERHHAGIKMKYSETTPDVLAKEVVLNISKKVEYTNIPIDGASKAAQVLNELL